MKFSWPLEMGKKQRTDTHEGLTHLWNALMCKLKSLKTESSKPKGECGWSYNERHGRRCGMAMNESMYLVAKAGGEDL